MFTVFLQFHCFSVYPYWMWKTDYPFPFCTITLHTWSLLCWSSFRIPFFRFLSPPLMFFRSIIQFPKPTALPCISCSMVPCGMVFKTRYSGPAEALPANQKSFGIDFSVLPYFFFSDIYVCFPIFCSSILSSKAQYILL